MAQKAKKDLAKSNAAALQNLHTLSIALNAAFLAFAIFLRPRSLKLYGVLSIPAFAAQFILERSGRPVRDPETGAVRSAGQDLGAEGLTAYMFDVVWVTWATLVFVILIGDKGWFLWTVVPAYGGYQAGRLLLKARGLAGGLGGMTAQPEAAPQGGNRKQRRAA
ncbi:unnamed protein product [Parascedosporium putredinis]|uniref:DUF788-domain-containing protein n=1 Tax=Parascedosporium putredinis TaxID=1442378 RepID=A0A9P1H9M4_9PEZI|nr:unnamed protein product [Parascedosporium putredinis]CAI8003196.1 unnamed protein product [Parascedosporium putredinis]